jgi:hypothetical protein
MAQHTITITVLNNAAGVPTDQDGIMGLIMQGVAVGSTLTLDTPYLIQSPTDAANLGITAAYDATNGTAVFQQINEFYDQAGPGAFLWIQVCSTATAYATYVNGTAFSNFIKFSQQADVTMGVKIVGLCYAPPSTVQSAGDFPSDVEATVTAVQTVQQQMFQAGYPFSVIVDGYNMSSTATPGSIGSQATNTATAVSICVTGTIGNGVSAVGLALGKAARISIGHGWGAVADGAIATSTAYLTNGIVLYAGGTALIVGDVYTVQGGAVTYNSVLYQPGQTFTCVTGHTVFTTTAAGYLVFNSTPIGNSAGGSVVGLDEAAAGPLGAKQYMYITAVQGITGLFWNDAATCCAATNFFSDQSYNRVMNSLCWDARAYFTVQFRGQTLPSDPQTGALEQTLCLNSAKQFYTTFIGPLSATSGSGDISDGTLTISGATYSTNGNVTFVMDLVRSTEVGNITGTAQFTATLTS